MRSTSVVLFFCPLCFVLTVLNITLLSCQAWDGWTPPVTTSIASKALSIKDHAFAPAAGTAEVAGWTPVTSVATVAASSLSAHSSGECSMGSVSKGLSIKDHAFVPAAGATGWTARSCRWAPSVLLPCQLADVAVQQRFLPVVPFLSSE